MNKCIISKMNSVLALGFAAMLAAGPALADKPSWAGNGKDGGNDHAQESNGRGAERREGGEHSSRDGGRQNHFDDRQRVYVRDYYDEQNRAGRRCPPGLAKKRNGCTPPGLARKWQIGQPLSRDVVHYPLPRSLLTQFGPAPSGHRYVRVGSDILMMATSNRLIVDSIQDLGRL